MSDYKFRFIKGWKEEREFNEFIQFTNLDVTF